MLLCNSLSQGPKLTHFPGQQSLTLMLTGTNINMADENQAQQLITNTIHQASSFPVGSNAYTQNQYGTMSSRKVEKKSRKRTL